MADREWFVEGVQIYETGEEEYFVEGVQVCEDQAEAPPAGTTIQWPWQIRRQRRMAGKR